MKLVWSPENASKAYLDTVKSFNMVKEPGEPEFVSALAGGWNPKLIIEAYFESSQIQTSVGLSIAARHTGGRHISMVSDERSRLHYINAMESAGLTPPELMVGDANEIMVELVGIDFLVVDGRRKDMKKVLRFANLSHRGAVLVCTNANKSILGGFRWSQVLSSKARVVRSLALPVGKGLSVAYVAGSGGNGKIRSEKGNGRWIKLFDHKSGEEHLFRG